eukprot:gnl/MRDRNA2_/MRDRNA2_106984_c0_seq1.p1 gnl/MRDRNA2_/MRDRNA2_106984_c0~~gnl/MRDRNA2_/MRDRNA2_106984_c0_seq1.p1  ORF type:complete len:146 (+),score=36.58 gnl/MRDRNA2_/MRDRNA2_106984_c0_seq1:107-544(+)
MFNDDMNSRGKPKRASCMADILATLSSDDDMPVPPPMLPLRRARTDPITTWQPKHRAHLDPNMVWQHANLMFSDGMATASSDDDTPMPPPMMPMHRARTDPIGEDIQNNGGYQAEKSQRAKAASQSRENPVTKLQEHLAKQASEA